MPARGVREYVYSHPERVTTHADRAFASIPSRVALLHDHNRLKNLEQHRLKFLVVDDSERWRRFMRCLFEKLGSVVECRDGDEAAAAFADHHPDWVFMDVEMKRMDGFTAARQIRSRFADARIVFVSQYTAEDYRHSAAGMGVQFIVKDEVDALQKLIDDGYFHRFAVTADKSA